MVRAVLDTNVLASALSRDGIPGEVFKLAITQQIKGVISPFLLAELSEVLVKKFQFSDNKVSLVDKKLRKKFILVNPTQVVDILPDNNPDNHVLEAADEGDCDYIISGDKQLLRLGTWKVTKILTARQFYEQFMANNN